MSTIRGNADFEYQLAVRQGSARRIRTLIKNKVKPPERMMLYALLQKHPELLPILREAGANPNDVDGFHNTALGHAILCYPVEVVKTLLKFGADPNQECTHLLPLVHAACADQIECIVTLLNNGGNPNLPQWNGVIPLHSAVRNGQPEIVKCMLQFGADPKIKGPDKRDSIQLAILDKRKDLVELLKATNKVGIKESKIKQTRSNHKSKRKF